jgi:rubredoxin
MWDCPNCGRENFQRAIILAITEEDREEMGLDSDDGSCWQSYPNVVICQYCKTSYETRHIDDEEYEDEEDEDED